MILKPIPFSVTPSMPLFKHRPEPNNETQREPSPPRKGGIFSTKRSRSLSPPHSPKSNHTPSTHDRVSPRRGFFGRRNSSDSSDESRSHHRTGSIQSRGSKGGFFGIGHGNSIDQDSTIMAARQKVTDAEEAERQADRALIQARGMVKEAREHVKILEREALDDARRAKAKQAEAKIVSKAASSLGRHG